MLTQPFTFLKKISFDRTRLGPILMAIAGLFVTTGALNLDAASLPTSLSRGHLLLLTGGWTVAWVTTCWFLYTKLKTCDPLIIPTVALLTGWGLLLQARLAPRFMLRQLVWLFVGNLCMCFIAVTPGVPRLLRRYRYTILTFGLILLGATLVLGVNPSGYGQELWLGAFGFYLQPSEPLKLLMIVYLAAYLSDRRELTVYSQDNKRMWFVVLGPMLVMVGAAMLLLLWQQDLGAALLYYLTFTAMLYLAWGKGWYIVLSLLLFLPVAITGYYLSSRVALRINIWLNPWSPQNADSAFQILQSLYAFGAGGLIGQGLGQGAPTVIPAVHTDFVFAALAEEFGLLGIIALLILMTVLSSRGITIAQKTKWPFESLLAGGIAALIGIQIWVITGGNTKLIPITGVTLPFLSYGGSSLVTMLIAVGLLVNLSTPHPPPITISLEPSRTRPIYHSASHLGMAIIFLVLSVSLISGYWSIYRAEDFAENPTNPRYILSEARIRRGTILDRNAVTMADISIDKLGYVTRTYPVPEAAPVIGYATFDYGLAGIESTCNSRLRGDHNRSIWDITWERLQHIDPIGQNIRLTLDARYQQYADKKMEGLKGAAILVDAHTGEILVLVSSPTYDPTYVGENWESLRESPDAPLLNRATQGLAQPGAILESVILASFWEDIQHTSPMTPVTSTIKLNGSTLTCLDNVQNDTWEAVYQAACPAPFAHLNEIISPQALASAFDTWRLREAPKLEISTIASDWDETSPDLAEELLGQGNLLVTPLHMAQVAAILGNDGHMVNLHLLMQPLPGCGDFSTPIATEGDSTTILDPIVAASLRAMMKNYGKTIGHYATALAGPNRIQSWFIGLNSSEIPRYAVAVLVESETPTSVAIDIGTDLLELASGL